MFAIVDSDTLQILVVAKKLTPDRIQAVTGIRSGVAVGPVGDSRFRICPVVVTADPLLDGQERTEGAYIYKRGEQVVTRRDTATDLPLDAFRERIKTQIAQHRWGLETGGVDVGGGVIVRTDEGTIAKLVSVVMAAQLDAALTVDWKAADGTFAKLTAATILAALPSIQAHVQSCFTAEAKHCAALDAVTTVADLRAYDWSTGWPADLSPS